MEPIPETVEVAREYLPFARGGADLLTQLQELADRVRESVPDCVGMSLAFHENGVTLTLVATSEEIASLDGVQYVAAGPCEAAVEEERIVEFRSTDPLDERQWTLFAQASAAAGIASTLTLPVVQGRDVLGSVNLYAASLDAFEGKHEEVARIFHAWAPGAVTNADLGFTTRRTAEGAPALLQDEMRIQVAVGIIVAAEGVDPETARQRLMTAAEQAGTTEVALAGKLIDGVGDEETRGEP